VVTRKSMLASTGTAKLTDWRFTGFRCQEVLALS
jgi:hypothetical protein